MTANTRPFTATAMARSMALWTPCGKSQGLPSMCADYREHAMGHGANAAAIAYVELAASRWFNAVRCRHRQEHRGASLKLCLGVNRALKR